MQDTKWLPARHVVRITVALAIVTAIYQPSKVSRDVVKLETRNAALLSIVKGFPDFEKIEEIYPNPQRAIEIYERAKLARLPWFENNRLIGIGQKKTDQTNAD
ncbi:MAG: hypothetical protein P8M63_11355 [Paracoccaceae bacterium]|nr:hypothetical protein [Paracoccaceae bacterium]